MNREVRLGTKMRATFSAFLELCGRGGGRGSSEIYTCLFDHVTIKWRFSMCALIEDEYEFFPSHRTVDYGYLTIFATDKYFRVMDPGGMIASRTFFVLYLHIAFRLLAFGLTVDCLLISESSWLDSWRFLDLQPVYLFLLLWSHVSWVAFWLTDLSISLMIIRLKFGLRLNLQSHRWVHTAQSRDMLL